MAKKTTRAAKPKPSAKPGPHGYSWGPVKRSTLRAMVTRGTALVLGDSSRGRVNYDGGNEFCTDSKYNDPSKNRVGSEITAEGGGGGAYSFDALLNPLDPGGTRIELAFIAVTQNEYVRGDKNNFSAMLKLYMRDERIPEVNGNADPKYLPMLVMYCGDTKGHPALELHPTIAASLRQIVGGGSGGGAIMHDIWAPNGLSVTQMNDDGNFVTYRLARPFDKGRYKATFSSDSGIIPVSEQKWEGV